MTHTTYTTNSLDRLQHLLLKVERIGMEEIRRKRSFLRFLKSSRDINRRLDQIAEEAKEIYFSHPKHERQWHYFTFSSILSNVSGIKAII